MKNFPKKAPRGQFKCFQCRLLFSQRDGDWVHWDSMEVHLCRGCDHATAKAPERTPHAQNLT